VLISSERRVVRLAEPARRHGVVGTLRVTEGGWDQERAARVADQILTHGEAMMAEVAAALGTLPAGSPRLRATLAALLRFAGQQLRLETQPDGSLTPWAPGGLAQRVLELPLYALGHGSPVSLWSLVRERCTFGGADPAGLAPAALGASSRRSPLARLAAGEGPDELRVWVRTYLGTAAKGEGSQGHDAPLAPDREGDTGHEPGARPGAQLRRLLGPLSPRSLCHSLEHWLQRLRPDLPDERGHDRLEATSFALLGAGARESAHLRSGRADLREWRCVSLDERGRLCTFELGEMPEHELQGYFGGARPLVALNPAHWLVRRALARAHQDPEALAWLLLASYAHINALLDPVTNDHERIFQVRVARALLDNELFALEAPA